MYFFGNRADILAESSELQPLLHTWSLSVEEQFYILLPLLLVYILRRRPKWAVWILSSVAVVSLILNVTLLESFPSAVFYLLPSRAWELLSGSLLALVAQDGERLKTSQVKSEFFAVTGLAAIIVPMLCYTEASPFPGWAATIPIVGSVLLIAANLHRETYVGKLISQKVFVGIGLLSYSLYLWHWPVFVFSRHIFIDNSLGIRVVGLVITVALSYLSWRYIETPFRHSRRLKSTRAAFCFGAGITAIVGGSCYLIYLNEGYPQRFNEQTLAIVDDLNSSGRERITETASGVPIGLKVKPANHAPPDFVLWGDSHAIAVSDLIDQLAEEHGLRGQALLLPGTVPVTGLWRPLRPRDSQTTLDLNRSRFEWITNSGVKHVILICRWNSIINGLLDTEIDARTGHVRNWTMVVDSPNSQLSSEDSRDALARQLDQMVNRFNQQNIKVWLVLQVPTTSRAMVARDFYKATRFPILWQAGITPDTSKNEYQSIRTEILEIFKNLSADNVTIVDPLDFVYKDSDELVLFGERAYYRDQHHLTRAGAEYFLRDMLNEVMDEIEEDSKPN